MTNKLFCILAKAGAGKDTIMKMLLQDEEINSSCKKLVSNTTRPKRQGEKNGVEYKFSTNENFTQAYRNNEIAEWACYNRAIDGKAFYYTLMKDIDLSNNSLLKIVNPVGLAQLKGNFKDDIVTIYIDCSEIERIRRQAKRGDNREEILRRLDADDKDFEYLKPNYTVTNENRGLDEVVKEVKNIIMTEIGR